MKYREDVGSTYLGTDFQPDKDMLLHDNIDDLYDKVRDAERETPQNSGKKPCFE